MARDLRPLFDPRSVAVVGASDDPAKWGNWLGRGALRGEHRRPVYLVNRKGGTVLGRSAYRSLGDLPDAPELVVVSVPAAAFEQTVDDALAAGARALIGITAGLGERGDEAGARERELVGRVRDAGAMLLGPNCLGVYDAASDLGLASNEFPAGSIGLVSQSGNLALELGILARASGLGFSRFASIGNQADVDLAELVTAFGEHPETRAIAVYAEDFRDGRAFVDAAAAAGKPVVLLTVGASEASVRAARSHTGALVSDGAVVAAAARAAGIHVVKTPHQMIDLINAQVRAQPLRGNRVAVIGDGGGHGAVACDVATAAGLELPRLSDGLSEALAAQLPDTAATRNPVDLAGGGEQDFYSYAKVSRTLLESGEVDGVLLTGYFGGYADYSEDFAMLEGDVARAITAAVADSGRPMVAHSMHSDSPTAEALLEGGVPVYTSIEAAAGALAGLRARPRAAGAPPLPPPATGPIEPGYFGSRALLEAAGVPFAPAVAVTGPEEALAAAGDLGYPVVVKAVDALHKSDAGGVIVGIADPAALVDAVHGLIDRLAPSTISVERMAPLQEGVELIVGARTDPRFGPVAMVGLGGIYAEVFGDVAVDLAPLDPVAAERLLRSLRGAPLLTGVRGRPPLDVGAAARAAAALSQVAAARPDVAEIEINPLLVTPSGATALDARVIAREKGEDDAR
ncbi:MAG TPA: acetate--CoA ligase family protein [Gaiellales bacterium]|nr:acetate--CoA ligase family protein [Gaiellales bacterium]